jgi:hypothetical protein
MSFIKIQKIDPNIISNPDHGHIYLGQDNYGLWQKDENGLINYILSGNTYITINSITGTTYLVTGSTSSGTSGTSGFGTSGTSGKSGVSGTFGTSGSSGNGTSGTSGFGTSGSSSTSGTSGSSAFGSSGTSATSGSSATSGVDGNGSSGTSGINGGYGGATRKWSFTTNTTPPQNYFNAYSTTFSNYDLVLLNYIRINQRDFDNQDLDGWIDSWSYGFVKIEDELNLQNYGLYKITNITKISLDTYQLSGFTILSGNGTLVPEKKYLISYIFESNGSSGTSGTSGNDNHNELLGLSGGTAGEYFHLTQTQWGNLSNITTGKFKEQSFDALSFNISGTSLTMNLNETTIDFDTTADIYQYLTKNIQIDHDKELNSSIKMNLHWFQTENNNPNFLLQYRYQRIDNEKENTWNYLKCNNLLYTYTTGTTLHQVSYSSSLPIFSGTTISNVLQIRIIRDKYNNSLQFTGNDLYSIATNILTFGVIYTVDSFGSNSEFIK